MCLTLQEKGAGLFSGLLKKTPKASAERPESLVTWCFLDVSRVSHLQIIFFTFVIKSDFFFVLQDTEVQKELSASNDDLPESNSTKVSSRMQHRLKVELS